MGYILPLYQPHPIFGFKDPQKIDADIVVLREYFETDEDSKVVDLLRRCDKEWEEYGEQLLRIRRRNLFNSYSPIPNELSKVDEYAKSGSQVAIEMKKILDFKIEFPRTWPNSQVEEEKKRYAEWKRIPRMEEEALDYLLYEALRVIYYPKKFFDQRIFKLEEEYKDFIYDFMDFMGPEGLYISYLIFKKKGNEGVYDNIRDFVVGRYIPKPTIGIDAISILTFFLNNGNDANNCNQFFTRRMKDDISKELDEYLFLTNNRNDRQGFEPAFKRLFYASLSACNIRNPFERVHNEPGLIEQALLNHMIGNYSASINLLFPLIEGIIWDISIAEHLRNGGIYTLDTDLTTRDVRKRTLLGRDGSPVAKPHGYPTLKELLESTRMSDIINTDFFEVLIQEMYPLERNPILHGVRLDYSDPWQSSRMLLMLEYLHHLIREKRYLYPGQLDKLGYWTPQKRKEN